VAPVVLPVEEQVATLGVRYCVGLVAEFGLARVRPRLLEFLADRHFGVGLLPCVN